MHRSAALLPPGALEGIVVDVGAGSGSFALLAAGDPRATVHAYEPNPARYRALLEAAGAGRLELAAWPYAARGDERPAVSVAPDGYVRPIATPEEAAAAHEDGCHVILADELADIILRHCPADVTELEPQLTPEEELDRVEALAAGQPWQDTNPHRRAVVRLGQLATLRLGTPDPLPLLEHAAGHAERDVPPLRRVRVLIVDHAYNVDAVARLVAVAGLELYAYGGADDPVGVWHRPEEA